MSQTKKDEAPEDTPMDDVPAVRVEEAQADEEQDEEASGNVEAEPLEVDVQSVRILPGSTDKAASFEFLNEGHTLGNALRYIIMKNPDVEMCAYTIPHPSEPKMNVRIQTYGRHCFLSFSFLLVLVTLVMPTNMLTYDRRETCRRRAPKGPARHPGPVRRRRRGVLRKG
jgi:DNA-directed RNA polymerase I and III subunit RPAC2